VVHRVPLQRCRQSQEQDKEQCHRRGVSCAGYHVKNNVS
jgi:hypothetical protein